MTDGRQAGMTTLQMMGLPIGGLFIWCNEVISYPIRLAQSIGREDIIVKPWSYLERREYRGSRFPGWDLDHACPSPWDKRTYWSISELRACMLYSGHGNPS